MSEFPAIKGRMGNIDYYILSIKARELTKIVETPKKIKGWNKENMDIEEIYQRDINLKRVKEQLAPYWAEHKSHFFGSIIVSPINFEAEDIAVHFEPVEKFVTQDCPISHRIKVKNIGLLTIPDETILVPLDGQHRVKAIQFAITGKDEEGKDIKGLNSDPELGKEDISVLLVAVNMKQARGIFTHVNRYARPTDSGRNYITSDDDILAVIARRITNKKFSARLVKYEGNSNTLNAKDRYFTTLSTIYNCMDALAKALPIPKLETISLPDKSIQNILHQKSEEVWDALTSGIDDFSMALQNKGENGDENRIELRKSSLLGRPVAQECLFRAFLRLTGLGLKNKENNHSSLSENNRLSYDEAIKRLNRLPWTLTKESAEKVWQNVLWSGSHENGKMITKNRNLASDLIFYLAGGNMDEEQKAELLTKYQDQFTESDRPDTLPSI